MGDTLSGDIDEYRAWSENGTDQCPYCGEGIKATDTVLTVEGKETVPAATNSVAESLYHPDCYADREAEIRNDENRSLTDFVTDGGETPGHGVSQ